MPSIGRTIRGASRARTGGGVLLVAGLVVAGYGVSMHLAIAARIRAAMAGQGHCDGCAPWHPLFVVAPLALGSVLVLVGGYLATR